MAEKEKDKAPAADTKSAAETKATAEAKSTAAVPEKTPQTAEVPKEKPVVENERVKLDPKKMPARAKLIKLLMNHADTVCGAAIISLLGGKEGVERAIGTKFDVPDTKVSSQPFSVPVHLAADRKVHVKAHHDHDSHGKSTEPHHGHAA